ncbi:ABC transporter ATP-binding protein/permease [Lysinibacillus cavernae]|uniref:ABC transporter ATP-binding protein/permease n=1 Tax=Lysinibacillus cavernae TaxID=2666135 RepID=UPI0012D90464|nr:ABC transporter ATP-binding protein/permease [Lysinibacillus cavernae]
MIQLRNVTKKYGDTTIYSNVNYEFKDASLTCFLGPSGSGKSTLFNLLAGFDSDFTGEIVVGTTNIKDLSPDELPSYRLNSIGFIFQEYHLLDGYTALENVLLAVYSAKNAGAKEYVQKAQKLLVELGLEPQIHQKVQTLSGGQKQRVAIARSLINDPAIILADEPTGALDQESALSIMKILKKISTTKTVLMITHDEELATFGDEIIEIEDEQLIVKKASISQKTVNTTTKSDSLQLQSNDFFRIGFKNFKIHLIKYVIAAILIACGSASFLGTVGSKEIMNHSISEFKEKNAYFNKGMIPKYDQGIEVNKDLALTYERLSSMKQVQNVYYQYDLKNISLTMKDVTINNEVKMPTAPSTVSMVYGNMPQDNKKEMVISPSLASKFEKQIQKLVGERMALSYVNKMGKKVTIELTIAGITDTQYDDFIVSASVEKDMYKNTTINNATSISFDVKGFNEIPKVQKLLIDKQVAVYTNYKQVENFNQAFTSLIKLFTFVSYFVLAVALFISTIMLYKISIERYKEIGLLSALGFKRKHIKSILFKESLLFSGLSTIISLIVVHILNLLYKAQFNYGLGLNLYSYCLLIAMNMFVSIVISFIINQKLVKTETISAIRK